MNGPIKIPSRHISMNQNVTLIVRDKDTNKIVSVHEGHNAATNSLLYGIGHYLTGDGILNQGWHLLSSYIPKYISLGTMGLYSQEQDDQGYPAGIGVAPGDEAKRFKDYIFQTPGYGADGYDVDLNNNREYFGLGPTFANRVDVTELPPENIKLGDLNFDGVIDNKDVLLLVDYNCGAIQFTSRQLLAADVNQDGRIDCTDMQLLRQVAEGNLPQDYFGTVPYTEVVAPTVNCELISDTFPRAKISFRDIVPEIESEFPETIDVVFSAMISTGALAQFREPGKDYLFITEAGLWSRPDWVDSGDNGLLAAYRLAPTDQRYWGVDVDSVTDTVALEYLTEQGITPPTDEQLTNAKEEIAARNINAIKQSVLRVGVNQVVQVIWKIQLGGLEQLQDINSIYPDYEGLYWVFWE